MDSEHRPGYYKDHHGVWQRDRRLVDRRKNEGESAHKDRRANYGRRKSDEQTLERDHREMIQEALEEFEAEHGH